jgi:hypothetical protein
VPTFDEKLAAVRTNQAPPAPASSFEAKLAAIRQPSIADQARASLAKQNLTPEQVKAGGGVTSPDDITFDPPKQTNGGFLHGIRDSFSLLEHPLDALDASLDGAAQFTVMGDREPTAADVPVAGQVLGYPSAVAQTAKESYQRGAANESRADMYGQVTGTGLQFAAGAALGKKLPKVPATVREGGINEHLDVIDPKRQNLKLSRPIAEELFDQGVRMRDAKAELPAILDAKANAVDTTTPVLNRATPATTKPILGAIQQARSALHNENGVIRHPDMQPIADNLHALERHITATAPDGTIPNQTLANLHQDYNYFANKEGSFDGVETNPVRLPANAHVAEAIRGVVNEDPIAAAANARKSAYLEAKRVLPQTALPDTRPSLKKAAGTLGAAAATTAIGSVSPIARFALEAVGVGGGIGAAGKMVWDVMRSPAWKTAQPFRRAAMFQAIHAGKWEVAGKLARIILTESAVHSMHAKQ